MHAAPLLASEAERLTAVVEYGPEQPFDAAAYAAVLNLACDLFHVPTAFVSFVQRDTQVFPVGIGLVAAETGRDVSFCTHTVAAGQMLVVLDARLDPRFADNPLVAGAPHVRFYAGAPLFSPSGHVVGTFCIVDMEPRESFDSGQRMRLDQLATMVLDRLELRRLDIARRNGQIRFENIASSSPDGIICANADGIITFWNEAAARLFGFSTAEALGRTIDLIVPPRLRAGHDGGLQRVAHGGTPRLVGTTVALVAQRRDGTEFPIELSLSMWQQDGHASFGAILRDTTERHANEQRLLRAAQHDMLTDLPNRKMLEEHIEALAAEDASATLLLVDLDGFKIVNDDLGHAAGDEVLKVVAERLLACVRSSDAVCRLGGDEFVLLLRNVADHLRAARIADSVIQALSRPIGFGDRVVTIGASIGVAVYPTDGSAIDSLLSSADLALYQAKAEGRHCYRTFTSDLRDASDRVRAYSQELRRAYENDEFEVFYQPQICLEDGVLMGAEALLRWRHPTDGLLVPAAFIATLEHRPISALVGHQVLRSACRQAAIWRNSGAPKFRIGVNLFGSQFSAGTLVQDVVAALAEADLPANALELEITEHILMRRDETMLAPLQILRARGVSIAFDDFGTGFASLSMLKHFPVTRLKVDQSFVRSMCDCAEDAAIVRCVLYLGKAFGFAVTAEGVETAAQAELLAADGCDEVQGYLYGRPMSADAFATRFGLTRVTPEHAAPSAAPRATRQDKAADHGGRQFDGRSHRRETA